MIMKVEKEVKYVAPEVEVLEVEVEQGFATSAGDPNHESGNPFE